jgi:hypothetical protein
MKNLLARFLPTKRTYKVTHSAKLLNEVDLPLSARALLKEINALHKIEEKLASIKHPSNRVQAELDNVSVKLLENLVKAVNLSSEFDRLQTIDGKPATQVGRDKLHDAWKQYATDDLFFRVDRLKNEQPDTDLDIKSAPQLRG